MEDHRLGELLRELPREHARPGFTARVLNRLESAERQPAIPRLALAGALAAFLAVGMSVLVDAHKELAQEVHDLSAPPPVVYLGGNEQVDLVLDLGKVDGSEGATPVVYHGETF
jgi:hypothetical protein